MQEIPFTGDAAQRFDIELAGRLLTLEAFWNDRSNVYTLNIFDATSGAALVASAPLVLGQEVLDPYNFDLGHMIVIDTDNSATEAGPDDLGGRVKVYWASVDEIVL
jgi:hypothetical protein